MSALKQKLLLTQTLRTFALNYGWKETTGAIREVIKPHVSWGFAFMKLDNALQKIERQYRRR